MNAHEWYVENRAGFVARSLEAAEERAFRDHLAGCAECAAEVARLEQDLAWLPMAVTPEEPPPGFARRSAERILKRHGRRRQWVPYGLAAAGVLLAIGIGYRSGEEQQALHAVLADREDRLMALEDTLSVLRGARQVVQLPIAMEGRHGGLLIFQDPVSHRWCVVVHGLPPAPAGNVYQFWFITEGGMVRSVTVNADPARPAFFTLGMPPVRSPVMGAALTVEPALNRSSEPQGQQLAHVTF
jgi:anti-sigma-K factor RskA